MSIEYDPVFIYAIAQVGEKFGPMEAERIFKLLYQPEAASVESHVHTSVQAGPDVTGNVAITGDPMKTLYGGGKGGGKAMLLPIKPGAKFAMYDTEGDKTDYKTLKDFTEQYLLTPTPLPTGMQKDGGPMKPHELVIEFEHGNALMDELLNYCKTHLSNTNFSSLWSVILDSLKLFGHPSKIHNWDVWVDHIASYFMIPKPNASKIVDIVGSFYEKYGQTPANFVANAKAKIQADYEIDQIPSWAKLKTKEELLEDLGAAVKAAKGTPKLMAPLRGKIKGYVDSHPCPASAVKVCEAMESGIAIHGTMTATGLYVPNKVGFIKHMRVETGMGLKEAKDIVDMTIEYFKQ